MQWQEEQSTQGKLMLVLAPNATSNWALTNPAYGINVLFSGDVHTQCYRKCLIQKTEVINTKLAAF